jgi:hypothetical protein
MKICILYPKALELLALGTPTPLTIIGTDPLLVNYTFSDGPNSIFPIQDSPGLSCVSPHPTLELAISSSSHDPFIGKYYLKTNIRT